uniref:Uncharacterized protein n=1 Tax=Cacopsylla melanoneura TaxID=428564 RepID=A0A8D8QMV2_9HEMI
MCGSISYLGYSYIVRASHNNIPTQITTGTTTEHPSSRHSTQSLNLDVSPASSWFMRCSDSFNWKSPAYSPETLSDTNFTQKEKTNHCFYEPTRKKSQLDLQKSLKFP